MEEQDQNTSGVSIPARVPPNKIDKRRPPESTSRESKLSTGTIWLMGGTVLLYELINIPVNALLPGIGPVLSGTVADLHFYLWFKMKGINFSRDPRRMMGWMGMLFFNDIEIADEISLPLGVAFTIFSVRAEEKLENTPIVGGIAKKAISMNKTVNKV